MKATKTTPRPRDLQMVRVEIPRDLHTELKKLATVSDRCLFSVIADALANGIRPLTKATGRRVKAVGSVNAKPGAPATDQVPDKLSWDYSGDPANGASSAQGGSA